MKKILSIGSVVKVDMENLNQEVMIIRELSEKFGGNIFKEVD